MFRNIFLITTGLMLGISISLGLITYVSSSSIVNSQSSIVNNIRVTKSPQIIGFLPYWLLDRASTDYSKYITTLTYFALRIDKDGTVQKLINPTQEEPGWHALKSGKVDSFLKSAVIHNIKLSLAIDSGDIEAINSFISNPLLSAQNLTSDTSNIMQQYQITDLNLDIEYAQTASGEGRLNFTKFVKEVKRLLPKTDTLTLEISPIDSIQDRLIDVKEVGKYVDNIVIMSYDYHSPDSTVSGPVAPLNGAGIISEYDVTSAVEQTLKFIPSQKLILGIPLYGYEWETLGEIPRLAIIPGSGLTASSKRAETLLTSCASCSAKMDNDAEEKYFSYLNTDTNTTHIIFFPDINSTSVKLDFARKNGLSGLALWALGYEGDNILNPLSTYKNN